VSFQWLAEAAMESSKCSQCVCGLGDGQTLPGRLFVPRHRLLIRPE